jgi:predicted Zn finger-like uncharacterized protein
MKFLCPQCKAKYRIADEKLAQRATSKMKCRKCGHIIDIKSAAVPESIRAGATDDDDDDDDDTGAARPVPRVAPKGSGSPQIRAATPPPRRTTATPPKRTAVAPPRRSGVVAVARAVPETEEPDVPDAPPQPATNSFDEEDAPTRIHDGGALSAAFSFAVGQSAAAGATSPAAPDEWYVGIDGSPIGPLTLQQLKEKAATRKATLDSLVWKDGFEEWKPLRDFPELVAIVEDSAPPQSAYEPEARTVPAPSPLDDQAREKVASVMSPDVLEELGVKKRKQAVSHPVAWIAVFVAMAFGVTIGIVLFSKTEKLEKIIYVPAPGQASAKPVEQEAPAGADTAQTLEESTVSGGGPKRVGVVGQPKPEPSSQKPGGSSLLKDFGGPNLGPAPGGGSDQGPGNAPGGQLDGASIQRTVANYSPGVRRGCWETALSSRAADAPTSARVGVTITIAGSGNVENVTTTGDPKGYPNLSRCIESKVRTWRFPRSSGTTTANVPFVFAAQ